MCRSVLPIEAVNVPNDHLRSDIQRNVRKTYIYKELAVSASQKYQITITILFMFRFEQDKAEIGVDT